MARLWAPPLRELRYIEMQDLGAAATATASGQVFFVGYTPYKADIYFSICITRYQTRILGKQ